MKCPNCGRTNQNTFKFCPECGTAIDLELAKATQREHAREYAKEYRQKNHDRILENKREYYKENRDRINEQARKRYRENRTLCPQTPYINDRVILLAYTTECVDEWNPLYIDSGFPKDFHYAEERAE